MAKLMGKEYSRVELMKRVGDISQIAGATSYTYREGRASGVDAIEMNNGAGLSIVLLPGRGMDIAGARYQDCALSFISKAGITSPNYYEEDDFLRGFFAGFLTTCGLTYMGAPCIDEGKQLGLHGRISNIPANDVSISQQWVGDDFVMKVTGRVTQSAVFGENMVLRREITMKLGENTIHIHDTVENCGYNESPFMLLYHFNFGYPLVDENTTLLTNCTDVRPSNEDAARGINECHTFEAPCHDYAEQVFYHTPPAKNAKAALYNEALAIGVMLQFDPKQLPHLIEWKQMGEGDYAVGLEPATWYPEGRAKAREKGELIFMQPFEKREFHITASIIHGKEEING